MTCLTCAYWNLRDFNPLQRFGFGVCAFPPKKVGVYPGPIHTCNNHRPADPRAVAKRKALLK